MNARERIFRLQRSLDIKNEKRDFLLENGWVEKSKGVWDSPYGWPESLTFLEALDFEKCCQEMQC